MFEKTFIYIRHGTKYVHFTSDTKQILYILRPTLWFYVRHQSSNQYFEAEYSSFFFQNRHYLSFINAFYHNSNFKVVKYTIDLNHQF